MTVAHLVSLFQVSWNRELLVFCRSTWSSTMRLEVPLAWGFIISIHHWMSPSIFITGFESAYIYINGAAGNWWVSVRVCNNKPDYLLLGGFIVQSQLLMTELIYDRIREWTQHNWKQWKKCRILKIIYFTQRYFAFCVYYNQFLNSNSHHSFLT